MALTARRAKRQNLILAAALIGASGSGKTLGGLLLAYGFMKKKYPGLDDHELWGKIALVDTEHERSLIYEGMTHQGVKIGEFVFINLDKPYTAQRYEEAQVLAKKEGAEIIVVDSISHAWEGDGGILEYQQELGGRFQDWKDANKVYRNFISVVTGEKHRIHTISTVRTKQEYALEKNELDKLEIKKMGVKPVQRDSLEYEFQVVLNVDMDHTVRVGKDNSGLFSSGKPIVSEWGGQLYEWVEAGEDVVGKREEERQQYIQMVRSLVEEGPEEIEKKLREIEAHKSVNLPLTDMSLDQLEQTYTSLNTMYMKHQTKTKQAATTAKGDK